MTDETNTDQAAPERIWLDLPSFNGAVGFAHPERHRKDGWPEYVRADLVAPSALAVVEVFLTGDVPALTNMIEIVDEVFDSALAQRVRSELSSLKFHDLSDPVTVHANMLRGTIAKLTREQIKHLHPDLTCHAPAEVAGLVNDAATVRCNQCMEEWHEDELERRDCAIDGCRSDACPTCGTGHYLMDIEAAEAATALAAQKAENERLRAELDAWKENAEALAGHLAEWLDELPDEDWYKENSRNALASHAKLKGDA